MIFLCLIEFWWWKKITQHRNQIINIFVGDGNKSTKYIKKEKNSTSSNEFLKRRRGKSFFRWNKKKKQTGKINVIKNFNHTIALWGRGWRGLLKIMEIANNKNFDDFKTQNRTTTNKCFDSKSSRERKNNKRFNWFQFNGVDRICLGSDLGREL